MQCEPHNVLTTCTISRHKDQSIKMLAGRNRMYALLAWLWLFIAITCYVFKAMGGVSVPAILLIASMFITFILVGDSFVRATGGGNPRFNCVPVRFIIGALISNILFYFIALLLPFGLAIDWLVVMVIAVSVWCAVKKRYGPYLPARGSHGVDLIFALISTTAVLFWCLDILHPIEMTASVAVLEVWPDTYYHMSQIGSLARSTGLNSLQDLQMAGAPVHAYHLASYIFPALIQQLAGASNWSTYAGFLVPFGLLLTSCAAFSLARLTFGKWPALAAGLSVLLIPDVVHQGFGNQFVGGYYWLQLIAPAGTYGVASAAVAFLFLFEAIRTGRLSLVAIGYLFVLITLMFKAQIFVAVSFPAFVFAALFMGKMSSTSRVALVILITAIYFIAIEISQLSPSVPVIRLDGSGLEAYSSAVMDNQESGLIKQTWSNLITTVPGSWALRILIFLPILVITTFGFVAPLYLGIFSKVRKMNGTAVAFFPLLVIAIYVLMATCLSLDTRHIGTPEELLHRPFVWAYFILLIWAAAGTYQCLFGDRTSSPKWAKYLITAVAVCLLTVPFLHQKGIQTNKLWGVEYQKLPICQVKAANFVRMNSEPTDVIQDSLNDRRFVLSGLSGRQLFAIDSNGIRAPSGVDNRLASLKDAKDLTNPSQVEAFMKENGITFYLTNPDDSVAWVNIMSDHKVFQCDQHRVYHF